MWMDRRKRHSLVVRMDDFEKTMLKKMAEELGVSESEMIRRALLTARVLYDPSLRLGTAVTKWRPKEPLSDMLRPIPELAGLINLDLKMWWEKTKKKKEEVTK